MSNLPPLNNTNHQAEPGLTMLVHYDVAVVTMDEAGAVSDSRVIQSFGPGEIAKDNAMAFMHRFNSMHGDNRVAIVSQRMVAFRALNSHGGYSV